MRLVALKLLLALIVMNPARADSDVLLDVMRELGQMGKKMDMLMQEIHELRAELREGLPRPLASRGNHAWIR